MTKYIDLLFYINKLNLRSKYNTLLNKKITKLPLKYHKFFIKLIKNYKNIGILPSQNIKFIKIKY